MKYLKIIGLAVLLVGVFAVGYLIYSSNLKPVEEPEKIKQEPGGQVGVSEEPKKEIQEFSLKDLKGKTVNLSDYRGKVVVVNFWASWCDPCKLEMPEMQALDKELKSDNKAVFLAVNLTDNQRETKELAKNFIENEGYDFLVLLDEDVKLATKFNITSIPQTFIIDKEGRVFDYILGMTTKEKIMSKVEAVG